MTYFYLFKTKDYVYCGQHRCANNKDPMKDCYMGSGKDWCDYLDNNGWHKIKEFRKHVERIILEVIYEDDREKVGEAEKKWIAYVKEKYPEAICNISKGSKPSWSYDTVEEAEEANKAWYKNNPEWHRDYYENNKSLLKEKSKSYYHSHKEHCRDYRKEYYENHKENKKIYDSQHKDKHKVETWISKHKYQDPDLVKFPSKWTEENKQEYIRQWNNHKEKNNVKYA